MYLRHRIGKLGEYLACEYLKNNGYQILEIDIVALEKNELVFIEVKTRTNEKYGTPVEAVNNNKQRHLIKTIEYYLYKRNLQNEFIRVDVIEIYLYRHKYKVNHIKQII